jgi:hypothetical protein
MCEPVCGLVSNNQRNAQAFESKSQKARRAGQDLARLMERQLGYVDGHIDNIALRLFIRAHWSKVSQLAHTIHEEGDEP